MRVVGKALNAMFKRPFIIFFTGIITLIYCIIDYFNPITYLIMGFNRIGKGNFLESIVYAVQLLFNFVSNTRNAVKDIIIFLIFILVFSLILGIIFSGLFYVVNKALDGGPKTKGEFIRGIRKFAIRLSWVSFRVLISGLLVFIILLIAIIPAVVITRAWLSGKSELVAVVAFLDTLTVGVVFFGVMFFSAYVFFWYPAAVNIKRKTFSAAKYIADNNFWPLVIRILILEIILVVSHLILTYINVNLSTSNAGNPIFAYAMFIINWVFKTLFFSFFITYIFAYFKLGLKRVNN
jgi:hypothetical protein